MVAPKPPRDPSQPVELRFNFSGAGWREVLGWLAEESGMALHVGDVPAGTFSYTDPDPFTTDEAIARLNLFLIPEGYSIVRRAKLLSVIALGEPRSLQQLDALAMLTPIEELDRRGDHEVVKCIIPLGEIIATEATAELQPLTLMTTPVVLTRSNQLIITDTAAKMRSVVAVIKSMSVPKPNPVEVRSFELKHINLDSVLLVAGRHLGLAADRTEGVDISVSADLTGKRLFASGTPEQVDKLSKLLEVIDVPSDGGDSMAGKTLKAHPVMGDSLQSVYDVLQTTLAGRSLRLTMDPKAGSIVALADDQVHQEIEKTIKEVQGPAVEFAVIDINRLDPYFVVNLIGELFGTNEETPTGSSSGYRSRDRDEGEEAAKPKGPRVDADPANRRLFVRGTADQIRQIRELVEGLGPQTTTSSRERLRLLPLASQRRQQILDAAERFWEGGNEIVILPGSSDIDQESTVIEKVIHPMRPAGDAIGSPLPKSTRPAVATPAPARTKSPPKAAPTKGLDTASPAADPTDRAEAQSPSAASGFVASAEQPGDATTLIAGKDGRVETSPIRGRLVPQGILIESDDPDALDRFQEHLMDIATTSGRTPSPPVVFYLKYVTADQAVKMLADLFDGGKSLAMTPTSGLVSGSSSSDYYFGSLTSSKDGLTTVTAGTATIVSDARLNRLIIQGTTDDVATIEGYLKIIDKGESLTNIETAGRSHVIELLHTNATDMAAVIREAYAGRVATAGSKPGQPGAPGQPGQPPRPEDRGNDGERGRDGEGNRDRREMIDRPTRDKQPEMTVAVHQPSNSLVVTAPDSLFAEVEQLVRSVDTRGERVIEVIPAGQGVDMESILKKLQGDESAIPSASRPSSSSGGSDSSSRGFGGSRDDRDRDRDRDRSR